MRLASFALKESPELHRVGLVTDDGVLDCSDIVAPARYDAISPMRRLIAAERADELARRAGTGPAVAFDRIRLLPPVPDPSKIIAAPVNYADHQREMNESIHVDGLGVFLKAPSSLVPHGGTVQLPYTDRRFDQEGELALVISRRARNLGEAEAMNYVFGYSPLLDMTMRGGEDRSTRKSFDTFTPMGPCLVTADEIGDPRELTLRCSVNGVVRQQARVADLIWSVPRLVAYASSVMTLLPGDIISTGTPAGVGAVENEDRIELVIDRAGSLAASVTTSGAVPCPTQGAGRGPVPPAVVTTVAPAVRIQGGSE